jgi:hypothetical protein
MTNNGTQNMTLVITRYRVAMRTATIVYPFRAQAGCKRCDSVNAIAAGFGCDLHRA